MTAHTETRPQAAALDNSVQSPPPVVRAAKRALEAAFGPPEVRNFNVRLWDGTLEECPNPAPPFTVVVRRAGALRRALLPPSELALVEGYLTNDLDIEGDIEAAGALADLVATRLRSPRALLRLVRALFQLPTNDHRPEPITARRASDLIVWFKPHTRGTDAASVRHHYDVGNDFYSLWLDKRMVYSCGYFPTGTEDIDAAQEAKLEHICRKLRLRAGESLLDVGCGWGALLEYAATHYGVSGVGITLSEPQAVVARERMARAGLTNRVRIEVRDYRDLPAGWVGKFDKAVSVGMREHVGAARLPGYFAAVNRALRPGGLFLDHGIGRGGTAERRGLMGWAKSRLWRRDEFIERYVFPGGELVALGALLQMAEQTGFEARDVENLREHYSSTLRCWVERLEAAHEQAASIVGEHTYRVWRLYMAATSLGFVSGRLTLIQTLLAKPTDDGSASVPRSRADLYG
jgi:cyclopropane-fatty-acyl-phospholipid synthase